MRIGTCPLCRRTDQDLKDSHFLAAGFYRLARDPSAPDPNPILVTEGAAMHSSKQASDFLLCGDCENRLNRSGESWVLAHCWHSEADFPLFAMLKEARPSPLSEPNFTVYEGSRVPGVDTSKLTYFAVSVFWRGAIHDWKLLNEPCKRLRLGPYEEGLRSYLMGEKFPEDTVLIVVVNSGMERMRNMMMQFPFLATRSTFRQFRFTIPGFTFQLFIGKTLPAGLRQMCSVRSLEQFIYMTPDADLVNVRNNLALVKQTKRVGKLARQDRTL